MKEISVEASAKVNLYLRVLGRRADGYHEILSLLQAVSLADRLIFRALDPAGAVALHGDFAVEPEKNLIVQAVRAFRAVTGIDRGVRIDVEKRIPAGAGLGGGSSDAAAALVALDRLWGTGLGLPRLRALAERLGSDVPFFLHGAASIVEGRGERVRPLPARSDFCLILFHPPFAIDTAAAYRWLDMDPHRTAGTAAALALEAMYREAPVGQWRLENSFDPVVEARFPLVAEIKRLLIGQNARYAGLSGSGSTVFGLFEGRDEAEKAARGLSDRGFPTRLAVPLEKTSLQ